MAGGRLAAADLVAVRAELAPEEITRPGAGEGACPFRAWLGRVTALLDRPVSRHERQPFHRSSAATASGAAAARARVRRQPAEARTNPSRRSTDGWLLGRVVAAPRHSFDFYPSTARHAAASASQPCPRPASRFFSMTNGCRRSLRRCMRAARSHPSGPSKRIERVRVPEQFRRTASARRLRPSLPGRRRS